MPGEGRAACCAARVSVSELSQVFSSGEGEVPSPGCPGGVTLPGGVVSARDGGLAAKGEPAASNVK